jgi:hypothetical protein
MRRILAVWVFLAALAMTAIERYREPPNEIEQARLYRQAEHWANSKLVPDKFQNNPAACMTVMLTAHALNAAVTPMLYKQFHFIGSDVPEPSAQLTVAMASPEADIWPVEITDKTVTYKGRNRRTGHELELTWTLDMAKRAGLLDEWVERWEKRQKTGETGTYNYKNVVVVRQWGEAVDPPPDGWPEWVTEMVNRGEIKHRDNWFHYPQNMLCARAAKNLAKLLAPSAVLGIGIPGWDDEPGDGVRIEPKPGDVDADAETGEITQEDPEREISDIERRELLDRLNALTDDERRAVSDAVMYGPKGGRRSMIPKLSDMTQPFTVAAAAVLDAELSRFEEAEIVPEPGAPPAGDDPAIDDTERESLIAAVGSIDPLDRAEFDRQAKEAGIPNLKQGSGHKNPVRASHAEAMWKLLEGYRPRPPAGADEQGTLDGGEPFV